VRDGWRRLATLGAGLALLVVATGCQVNTQINVDTQANGSGTVDVVVTLDRAATQAVGDVKSQLQTSDLVAAGWSVTGPVAGTDGSTVLEATQAFATPAQASSLVAEIAGTGTPGTRPFQLSVLSHKTWWSTRTRLVGRADLTCDLACFGDSGLVSQLGTSTGVDPGTVASQEEDFTFGLSVTLPGKLQSSNAASSVGHQQNWAPKLGEQTVLSATTSSPDGTHLAEAIGAGAFVVLALIVGLLVALIRRRRRRRRWTGRHRRGFR
jgi:hypothetical protein